MHYYCLLSSTPKFSILVSAFFLSYLSILSSYSKSISFYCCESTLFCCFICDSYDDFILDKSDAIIESSLRMISGHTLEHIATFWAEVLSIRSLASASSSFYKSMRSSSDCFWFFSDEKWCFEFLLLKLVLLEGIYSLFPLSFIEFLIFLKLIF